MKRGLPRPTQIRDLERAQVVDLTHALSPEFDERSGTHVDAPAHCGPHGATVDRIEPAELVLHLAVVDIRERALRAVRADRLARARYDRDRFLDADSAGVQHSPGFSAELSGFLQDERPGVRAIVVVGAPALQGGSGGPARVLALVP